MGDNISLIFKVILWDHCYSSPPVFSSRKSESPSIGSSWGHSQHSQIFLLLFDHTFSRSLVASRLFVLLISAPLLVKDVNNVSSSRGWTTFWHPSGFWYSIFQGHLVRARPHNSPSTIYLSKCTSAGTAIYLGSKLNIAGIANAAPCHNLLYWIDLCMHNG